MIITYKNFVLAASHVARSPSRSKTNFVVARYGHIVITKSKMNSKALASSRKIKAVAIISILPPI